MPWSPWSWWRTYRDLERAAPAAVVIKYWIPFFAPGFFGVTWLLRRRTDIRVIYLLDNVIPHEKYPLGMFLTRLALRQGHRFIAQSDQVRQDLFTVLPDTDPAAVVTTPHPVYDFGEPGRPRKTQAEARRALGLPPDARLVLFFGFIKPYKGVVHLIDAAGPLKARFGDGLRILIVGDIYGESNLTSIASRRPGRRKSSSSSTASFPMPRSKTTSWPPIWRCCPTCRRPRAASSRSPTTTICRWSRRTSVGCPRSCWTAGPVSSCPRRIRRRWPRRWNAFSPRIAGAAFARGGGRAEKTKYSVGPHGRLAVETMAGD